MSLAIAGNAWKWNSTYSCWEQRNLVCCENACAPRLQCVNLYVPGPYLGLDGAVRPEAAVGGYTAKTAPLVLENCIGGYSEAEPQTLDCPINQGETYLAAGIVYVTAGARGRQTKGADGRYIGKAPAALVDLKAAVRFLRHNRAVLPGDLNRIVSVGVSAGGALSSLLGCTGDSADYLALLRGIGAAMDESDAVFAAQCYCPIIDLEHADIAYEWMFAGADRAQGMPGAPGGPFFPLQKALSARLAAEYPPYFNALAVRDPATGEALALAADGTGSADRFLHTVLESAAGEWFRRLEAGTAPISCTPEQYLSGAYTVFQMEPDAPQANGMAWHGKPDGPDEQTNTDEPPEPHFPPMKRVERQGTDKRRWLSWDGRAAHITSRKDLIAWYLPRLKPCTAFDALDLGQAENQELGSAGQNRAHFDPYLKRALAELEPEFPQAAQLRAAFADVGADADQMRRAALLNPVAILAERRFGRLAPHYRIRVGTHDPHTAFTMAMTLALKAREVGCPDVDYAMVWDADHGPADYPGELIRWIGRIAKEA